MKTIWKARYAIKMHKKSNLSWIMCWQDADAMLENYNGDTSEPVRDAVNESLYAWNKV